MKISRQIVANPIIREGSRIEENISILLPNGIAASFRVSINPTVDVALPKRVEKKAYRTRNIDTQKTLNMEQILTLIEASKDTPIHMQVLFAVLLGLRRCEINGVKYSDIDYINRALKV